MLTAILLGYHVLTPARPGVQVQNPGLTIVQPVTLDRDLEAAWEAASERRWSPLPVDAAIPFYAEFVLKNRDKLTLPEPEEPNKPVGKGVTGLEVQDVNGKKLAWIRGQETVRFDRHANIVMAAYSYAYWGKNFQQDSWVARCDDMSRLWLVSPQGANAFLPKDLKYQADNDEQAQAYSAFWALQRLKVDAQTPGPEVLDRIVAQASKPTTNLSQALLQAEFAQSTQCPTELRTILGEFLDAYAWPNPATLPPAQLPDLPWALAAEPRRKPTPNTEQRLKAAAVALAKRQHNADDPNLPSNPVFGGFSLDQAVVSNDTPIAAIALCEAGATLKNAHLMQRGVAGLRAAFGMFRTTFNLSFNPAQPATFPVLAMHEFGRDGYDLFTAPVSFEANEGKIVAAAAYIDSRFGSLYQVTPDEWVGMDTIRYENGNAVDILRNLKRPFINVPPYRIEVQADGQRKPLRILGRRPTIAAVELVSADPQPVVRVFTGASVTGAEVFQSQKPLTISINGSSGPILLAPDQMGFSGTVTLDVLRRPVTALLDYGGSVVTKTSDLIITPDFAPQNQGPRGWVRFGQLNKDPKVQPRESWLSTRQNADKDSLTGLIESPSFFGLNRVLSLTLRGKGGAKIQLLNDSTEELLVEFEPDEEETTIEWDLALFAAGNRLRLRLLDLSNEGYVEAKDIKFLPPTVPPAN